MELQLRPEVQKFVEDRVKAGQFSSTTEMVEAGIARLMLDPQPVLDEETLQAIEEGDVQADCGDVVPWDKLKAELMRKFLSR